MLNCGCIQLAVALSPGHLGKYNQMNTSADREGKKFKAME